MRAMRKGPDGHWIKEEPEDLCNWIWKHDGEEAVVIDDETQTYHCGSEELVNAYLAGGKKAVYWFELLKKLFHARSWDDENEREKNPYYCADGAPVENWGGYRYCSERRECGGKRRHCGDV